MLTLNEAHFALTETYKEYKKEILKQVLTYLSTTLLSAFILYIGIFCMPKFIYAYSKPVQTNEFEETQAVLRLSSYSDNLLQAFEQEEPDLEGLLPQPVYHSDSNWYLYSGYYTQWSTPGSKVWAHARDLHYRGLIHGADTDYQCTFFAQMWFYDIYGFNSSGNGPSSISGGTPHVLCVDEVDYRNDTITISDGNVMGSGEVRLRVTYTMSEFYRVNPGRYVFVNPAEELLEMLKNR